MLTHPSRKVRIMVTNTCLYLPYNPVITDMEDAAGHLAWMAEVFDAARENGEKVTCCLDYTQQNVHNSLVSAEVT